MKETLLEIAERLDAIQYALYYGDPEDEDELGCIAGDVLDISRQLTALANELKE